MAFEALIQAELIEEGVLMTHKLRLEGVGDEHETLYFLHKLLTYDWLLYRNDKDIVKSKVISFLEAVKSHFKNEEKFLESINSPEREEHRKAHEELIEGITRGLDEILDLGTLNEFKKRIWEPYELHILDWDNKIMTPPSQESLVLSPQKKQTETTSHSE